MVYVDLFSGIGGFALGAQWAELSIPAHYFSEVDPFCIEVYQTRFPSAVCLGDITQIDWNAFQEKHSSDLVVMSGGFPCQDISTAGKGAGITGKRSGLWVSYAEAISIVQPAFVLIENVSMLLARGMSTVLKNLDDMGYSTEWRTISAASFGAPHVRKRVWLVAYQNLSSLNLLSDAMQLHSFADTSCLDEVKIPTKGCMVDSKLYNVFDLQGDTERKKIWCTPTVNDSKNCTLSSSQVERSSLVGEIMRNWPTPRANDAKKGANCDIENIRNGLPAAVRRWPAPRCSCGNGGCLNPDWVEWLMGYPINWTAPLRDYEDVLNWQIDLADTGSIPRVSDRKLDDRKRLRALGNSIVPQIAYYLWKRIKEVLYEKATDRFQ